MSQDIPISSPEMDSHLSEEGLSDRLKHRSVRGGALMIVSNAIQMAVGISGTAMLARLLTPHDFGYLAMVATVINFVVTLREFLSSPTVQRRDLTHQQASGLFWINCGASIAVATGVAVSAPVLAWFFHEPRVQAITLAMSAGVLVSMLGVLHAALLRRQMRFGAITTIEIGATVAGVIVGVIAARLHAGYWALVYQQLTVWTWQTATAWMLCAWRPASTRASVFRSDAGIRSMLHYGQSATASRVLSYASRNTDVVLVGHFMGAEIVGLYQKAYQWAMMPFWQMAIPIGPVAVSSLSRLQHDTERYRLYARTIMLGFFGLALPGTALLMIDADVVIPLLMGPQWLDAIPMMRILGIGAYLSTFTWVMSWLYLSEGRTADQLRASLASAPVMVLGIAVGLYWGVIGVAWGFSAGVVVVTAPAVWYCLRRSPVTTRDFCSSFLRPVASSILAAGGLWLLRPLMTTTSHIAVQFMLHSCIYSLFYIISWLALPGGLTNLRSFLEHLHDLRQRSGD